MHPLQAALTKELGYQNGIHLLVMILARGEAMEIEMHGCHGSEMATVTAHSVSEEIDDAQDAKELYCSNTFKLTCEKYLGTTPSKTQGAKTDRICCNEGKKQS
eukprot:5245207-Amphidinium_carterae.1